MRGDEQAQMSEERKREVMEKGEPSLYMVWAHLWEKEKSGKTPPPLFFFLVALRCPSRREWPKVEGETREEGRTEGERYRKDSQCSQRRTDGRRPQTVF